MLSHILGIFYANITEMPILKIHTRDVALPIWVAKNKAILRCDGSQLQAQLITLASFDTHIDRKASLMFTSTGDLYLSLHLFFSFFV